MHVRLAWCGLALVLGAGCARAKPEKREAPVILRSAAADAGAVAVDPHFVDLARTARDAATRIASGCKIHRSYEGELVRFYDRCEWTVADLEPLRAAAGLVRAAMPDAGPGASFAAHVALFSAWIETITKERDSDKTYRTYISGTLANYQDLALAWNAFQPNSPVPVDIGKPSSSNVTLDAGADGGHLRWQRCSDGRCVVFDPPKERR